MIEEKISRYKNSIATAKVISKNPYADHAYYENLISRFEKILKFYENLKISKSLKEN
ncbi:MAG: hypothetical protein ACFFA8_08760 [Promethearchaeota archaeon]